MVRDKSITEKATDLIIHTILIIMALICLLPVVHIISVSFSDKAAATAGIVTFWPVSFSTAAYREIMRDSQFVTSFFVSVRRVLLGMTINMSLIVLTAFPLSRGKKVFPQRNFFMWFLVFNMLFSGGLIPTYLLVNNLGLVNTLWALVLPGSVPIFSIIVLMNFFKGVPDELDEAAKMDGANPWVTLFQIYLPLSIPSLATVCLFSIVGHWNSFFDGIIYIHKTELLPLQSYIQQLLVEIKDMSMFTPEEIKRMEDVSNKTFNAAKVFVTMVPVLCIYPFLQKYFVKGLVMGSVKG